jgi:hypothetical protein
LSRLILNLAVPGQSVENTRVLRNLSLYSLGNAQPLVFAYELPSDCNAAPFSGLDGLPDQDTRIYLPLVECDVCSCVWLAL